METIVFLERDTLRAELRRPSFEHTWRDYGATLPEHVLMMMLALSRDLLGYREDVRAGLWQRAGQFCLHTREIRDLDGATLGLVGHGTLGRGVERLARAFGMEVLVSERKGAGEVRRGRTPFEDVLRRGDVLS